MCQDPLHVHRIRCRKTPSQAATIHYSILSRKRKAHRLSNLNTKLRLKIRFQMSSHRSVTDCVTPIHETVLQVSRHLL